MSAQLNMHPNSNREYVCAELKLFTIDLHGHMGSLIAI